MARFITRVELHGAVDADYTTLHGAMNDEGFGRTIKSGDGTVYQLPTAEYHIETELPRNTVLENAKRAATKTNKKFGVMVTEAQVSTWYGLPIISQPKPAGS